MASLNKTQILPLQISFTESIKTQPLQLHLAAQNGNKFELRSLLNSPTTDPFQLDLNGRTPLHHAANYGNQQTALDMATLILDSKMLADTELKTRLINIQDENGETALHLAARIMHRKVVKLLLFGSADVNLKSKQGVEPIELIYAKVPHAMCSVFDTSIQYRSGEIGEDSFEVLVDFGPIVGYPTEDEEKAEPFLIESQLLAYTLQSESKCREILLHPLVQLFLYFKWNKVRPIFWTSIVLHILWLLSVSTFLVDLYLHRCPYDPDKKQPLDQNATLVLHNNQETITLGHNVQCEEQSISTIWAIITTITTFLMTLKETYEILSAPSFLYYFQRLENVGQLVLIVLVILTTLPLWTYLIQSDTEEVGYVTIHSWQYECAAVGVFLAWTLILRQIGKTPRLGLYVEILLRVLKSFGLFVITFMSLLTAFAFSFSIIMPHNESFSSWPLAISKVLVMMTGELNYDQVFYTQENDGIDGKPRPIPFFVMGHILFITFTVIVTIILFNLLIGLTVSDIQGLRQGANVTLLCGRLEQIYFMESFLFSKRLRWIAHLFNINIECLKRFQISSMQGGQDYVVTLTNKQIPKELLAEVKELSTQNINIQGQTRPNDGYGMLSENKFSKEELQTLIHMVVSQVLQQQQK